MTERLASKFNHQYKLSIIQVFAQMYVSKTKSTFIVGPYKVHLYRNAEALKSIHIVQYKVYLRDFDKNCMHKKDIPCNPKFYSLRG